MKPPVPSSSVKMKFDILLKIGESETDETTIRGCPLLGEPYVLTVSFSSNFTVDEIEKNLRKKYENGFFDRVGTVRLEINDNLFQPIFDLLSSELKLVLVGGESFKDDTPKQLSESEKFVSGIENQVSDLAMGLIPSENEYDVSWKSFFERDDVKNILREMDFYSPETLSECNIFPERENVFRIFKECPLDKIRCIIFGQDPYPTKGFATGIAFDVGDNDKIPASLKNIFKELEYEEFKTNPKCGDLKRWYKDEGIFLINSALTVREGKAGLHVSIWAQFTKLLIQFMKEKLEYIVVVAWGKGAEKLSSPFKGNDKISVLTTTHPSPLSWTNSRGSSQAFFESDIFLKVNDILYDTYKKNEIDWRLF